MARMELETPRHYKPNLFNLAGPGDHHEFRPVLNIQVYRWLKAQRFPYSLTITHCESSNPDLPRWTTKWLMEFERTIRCYIEFDDPGHLLLFKLTWG